MTLTARQDWTYQRQADNKKRTDVPTALVTGAAGFVGRHMTQALIRRGYIVVECDIKQGWNALDLFKKQRVQYDLVVHAAAVVGGRLMIDGHPLQLAAIDLELDAAMFRWALTTEPKRIVYLSSSAVYPAWLQHEGSKAVLTEHLVDPRARKMYQPDATYGFVKLVGERLAVEARDAGLNVTVVRPFSGYGADQDLDYPFPSFIDRAKRQADPFQVWGTGQQVRDFIHIDDFVEATLTLVDAGVDGPVNLCSGQPTSFIELAHMVCREAGYTPELDLLDDKPMGTMFRLGDPTLLRTYYTPQVSLADGIRRALQP